MELCILGGIAWCIPTACQVALRRFEHVMWTGAAFAMFYYHYHKSLVF